MFSNQIQALTAAGFTDQQIQVLCQCMNELTHRGPVFFDYQWPENATDNWGATRYRTNKKGIAGNVLSGRWIYGPDSSVEFNTVNITYNTTGAAGSNLIPFINISGETVPVGGAMKIVDDTIFADKRYLITTKPDTNPDATADLNVFPRSYVLNANNDVADGDAGVCYGTGYGIALCNGFPIVEEEWGPKPGSWLLQQGGYGFLIRGSNRDGFSLVEQRIVTEVEGTLSGDLTQGSSQVVLIGSDGFQVTAYDRWLESGKKLADTNRVLCAFYANRWNTIQSPCPVSV